jgi:hypothetical protein
MSPTKAHLYNPGKTACYWLVVDVYGRASAEGKSWGPQPIQEFYVFDSVDNWFTDNPQSVTINTKKEKGKVKVALQRAVQCMDFTSCPLSVREKLIDCERKNIDNDEAFNACHDAATADCKASAGSESTPAPDASKTPTTTPKTPATTPPKATTTPPKATTTTPPKTTTTTPPPLPTQPKKK